MFLNKLNYLLILYTQSNPYINIFLSKLYNLTKICCNLSDISNYDQILVYNLYVINQPKFLQ